MELEGQLLRSKIPETKPKLPKVTKQLVTVRFMIRGLSYCFLFTQLFVAVILFASFNVAEYVESPPGRISPKMNGTPCR